MEPIGISEETTEVDGQVTLVQLGFQGSDLVYVGQLVLFSIDPLLSSSLRSERQRKKLLLDLDHYYQNYYQLPLPLTLLLVVLSRDYITSLMGFIPLRIKYMMAGNVLPEPWRTKHNLATWMILSQKAPLNLWVFIVPFLGFA